MSDFQTDGMRTREIEEPTNLFVIHPLSRICVRHFVRWGVHPNSVSLAGLGLGAAAAFAYYHYQSWPITIVGFLLMIAWHVMDGSDGQLARLTGRTSEIGRILDGICDHGTFALVYLSLVLALTPEMGWTIWIIAALAGASHVIQASAYESRRQAFDFWVYRKGKNPWSATEKEFRKESHRMAQILSVLNRWYFEIQKRVASVDQALLLKADELSENPAERDRIAKAYSSVHLPVLRKWNILSSNYRTVAIFLTCLAGFPTVYFLLEISLLNIILVTLIVQGRRDRRRLETILAQSLPVARAA